MWDFAVIGGGIAGLSAAAHLAELGSVVLLESEPALGHHTSGRSAALYEPDYGAPATVAVTRASGPELARMGVLSPRGLLLVADATQAEVFAHDIALLHLSPLPLDQARAMVPILNRDVLAFAAHTDGAQDIDTDAVMQHYARALKGAGGQVRLRAPVTSLRRDADGWQIAAGPEALRARRIVNAAGAWADQVARRAGIAPIGLTPLRRSIAVIPAPAGHDIRGWPMLMGAGESWYAKPQAGKLLVSPADEDPAEPHDAWPDDLVLAEGLARYEAMVTEPVTRLDHSWAGLRSFAPDRALVLGPDPAEPTFLWCAGQGGQGFQSAPGAARVLLETAGGRPSGQPAAVIAALSPARLR